jgi:hypothetical protein
MCRYFPPRRDWALQMHLSNTQARRRDAFLHQKISHGTAVVYIHGSGNLDGCRNNLTPLTAGSLPMDQATIMSIFSHQENTSDAS